MNALLRLFIDLARFRIGPQDLPHSPALLGGLILVDLVVSLALAYAVDDSGSRTLGAALLQISLMLGLPYVVLHLARRTARFNQTASAIVGIDIVFTVIAAPVLLGMMPLPVPGSNVPPTTLQVWLSLVAFALVCWKTGVSGHVFRHALEISFGQGVVIALILFFVQQLLVASLGTPAPTQ